MYMIFFVMECLLDSRVIFWLFFENLRKFLQKSQICRVPPLTGEVAKRSAKIRNNMYHKLFVNQQKNMFKKSKIAQIYYCDPQSAGINLQSPQSDSTPWTLTLI